MDLTLITNVFSKTVEKLSPKSQFVESEYGTMIVEVPPKQGITFGGVLSFILGVVIGLYAAFLSWQCNTKLSYNMFLKVIFAIFAYLFGLVYLVLYVVMRWDTCRRL